MGMTIAEKILARHSGNDTVSAGELVFADLDLIMGTDVTTPLTAKVINDMEVDKLADPSKVVLVNDHFVPAKDIAAAELSKTMREFARKYSVDNYFEVGRSGICHVIVPEQGLSLPGDLIVGADSHTCTYGALTAFSTGVGSTDLAAAMAMGQLWFKVPETIRIDYTGKLKPYVCGKDLILYTIKELGVNGARYMAMEFGGEVIASLSMADRLSIANMAIEAGAKTGIVEFDQVTRQYVEERAKRDWVELHPDADANYQQRLTIDVSEIGPQVAFPSLPSKAHDIDEIRQQDKIAIDQVVIGSCTNGRIEDLRMADKIIGDKKIHPNVRLIIIPGTPLVYIQAVEEGLVSRLVKAGAVISPPTCGPCIGGHMGILADGEKALATTNRNFVGRMGHRNSEIYLSAPYVAAASAIAGYIASPEDI